MNTRDTNGVLYAVFPRDFGKSIDRNVDVYRGVPYAKTVNRFEHAEPVENWDFKDAKESGPACYQLMENLLQAKVSLASLVIIFSAIQSQISEISESMIS